MRSFLYAVFAIPVERSWQDPSREHADRLPFPANAVPCNKQTGELGSVLYSRWNEISMALTREHPPAEHLDLLYRVSRTLLTEGCYGALLSVLLDTLIEGLGADRGFVVVREAGEFRATVSRNFRSEALSTAEEAVSC